MGELLTPSAVAKMLSISVYTLRDWRLRGKGPPCIRHGNMTRYRIEDLNEWLNAHTENRREKAHAGK